MKFELLKFGRWSSPKRGALSPPYIRIVSTPANIAIKRVRNMSCMHSVEDAVVVATFAATSCTRVR